MQNTPLDNYWRRKTRTSLAFSVMFTIRRHTNWNNSRVPCAVR